MIIPIYNGRAITPVYISQTLTNKSSVSQQSNTDTQNNEPTLGSWISLGVFLICLIAFVAYFIKLLKDCFGGKE